MSDDEAPRDERHPTAGVRLLLELASSDEAGAVYDGAIFTPAERHDFRVEIRLPDGKVEIAPVGGHAVPSDLLRAQARVVAKDALSSTPLVWPRRLLRWRDGSVK